MTRLTPRDMFGTDDPVRAATLLDDYKETLNKSLASPKPYNVGGFLNDQPATGLDMLQKGLLEADVAKALSPEVLESVRNQLASTDIGKDLNLTSPISTGLVAFDLEAPKLHWAAA